MSGLLAGEAAVALLPGSACPVAEIGRALAYHFGLHPTDAIARVRYGGGVILKGVTDSVAEELVSLLAKIGVSARRVEAALLSDIPRGRRVRSLEFTPGMLRVRLITGLEVEVAPKDLAAVHLYALPHPDARRETPADEAALGALRAMPGLRALARRPLAASAEEERAAVEARWFRRHHHDVGEALEVSPRARKLRDALLEAGVPPPDLHLTLLCAPAIGPLRLMHGDIDHSSLGAEKMPHSLDNFLRLLTDLQAFGPGAWMAERIGSFLERLDPSEVLYFKPEEGQNLETWMQLWILLADREQA